MKDRKNFRGENQWLNMRMILSVIGKNQAYLGKLSKNNG